MSGTRSPTDPLDPADRYRRALHALALERDERLRQLVDQRLAEEPVSAALAQPAAQEALLRLAVEGHSAGVARRREEERGGLFIGGGLVEGDAPWWPGAHDVDAAIRASWGEMRIHLGSANLTQHTHNGGARTAIRWYLLPFLESLAARWDSAFAVEDGELDHLLFDSPGAPWPDIRLLRWTYKIRLSWRAVTNDAVGITFDYHPREAHLEPADVAEPLKRWSVAVATDLKKRHNDARVCALVDNLARLSTFAGNDRQRLAAAPLQQRAREVIQSVGDRAAALVGTPTRPGAARMAFGSAAPTISEADASALLEIAVAAEEAPRPNATYAGLRSLKPIAKSELPWRQGYALAQDALQTLRLDLKTVDWIDVDGILDELDIRVAEQDLDDAGIRAVTLSAPQRTPYVVINRRHRSNARVGGRRFTLAHELCHALHDAGVSRAFGITDGPWAPEGLEQRANAFAAMFLMPPELVNRTRSAHAGLPLKELARLLSDRLKTPPLAARDHLMNLRSYVRSTDAPPPKRK